MSKVLFLVNHDVVIYNFRLELVERLLNDGHDVIISSPNGERIDKLVELGAKHVEISINRHGINIFEEINLIKNYKELIQEVNPDIIFAYTIKPNIYGAIAAQKFRVPFVANITGLGTAVENPGLKQKVFVQLYKYAFRNIQKVFFQNTENQDFFINENIVTDRNKYDLLPGSGVNLNRYVLLPYPNDEMIRFAFISRIMKEKGIEYYLETAKLIKNKYKNVEFHICGFCEDEYSGLLDEMVKNGTVIYHGMINDIASFLKDIHCVVHPTYYPEGISNVLLEACASGRPIITTNRSGCREVVDNNINGYMIQQKDQHSLDEAVLKFLALSYDEKKIMGINGRNKVEKQFDRQIVVEAYIKELRKIK